MDNTYVITYGDNKGISLIEENQGKFVEKHIISVEGKANFVVGDDASLYTCEDIDGIYTLNVYDKATYQLIKKIPSQHFFSYGQAKDGKLFLASFTDGTNQVLNQVTDNYDYTYDSNVSRSHFIHSIDDGKYVSVDNGSQQVIFYKNDRLEFDNSIQFDQINIRLLSINGKYGYLNTEISNELITIDLTKQEVINKMRITDNEKSYSGGNAINNSFTQLAISQRFENKVYIFDVVNESVIHKTSFACKDMPRDILFMDRYLLVSCTNGNVIQVFDSLKDYQLVDEIQINQPVTFLLK